MFGIGMQELLIILVIALVVVGPDKLPSLAKAIGKGIGEFRKATDDLKSTIKSDDDLRQLSDSLSSAKKEMTGMVRDHTRGLNSVDLAKSLSEGSFFDAQKNAGQPADAETGPKPAEPSAAAPAGTEPAAPAGSEPAADPAGETAPQAPKADINPS